VSVHDEVVKLLNSRGNMRPVSDCYCQTHARTIAKVRDLRHGYSDVATRLATRSRPAHERRAERRQPSSS
jgi:hypothetical protein